MQFLTCHDVSQLVDTFKTERNPRKRKQSRYIYQPDYVTCCEIVCALNARIFYGVAEHDIFGKHLKWFRELVKEIGLLSEDPVEGDVWSLDSDLDPTELLSLFHVLAFDISSNYGELRDAVKDGYCVRVADGEHAFLIIGIDGDQLTIVNPPRIPGMPHREKAIVKASYFDLDFTGMGMHRSAWNTASPSRNSFQILLPDELLDFDTAFDLLSRNFDLLQDSYREGQWDALAAMGYDPNTLDKMIGNQQKLAGIRYRQTQAREKDKLRKRAWLKLPRVQRKAALEARRLWTYR